MWIQQVNSKISIRETCEYIILTEDHVPGNVIHIRISQIGGACISTFFQLHEGLWKPRVSLQ